MTQQVIDSAVDAFSLSHDRTETLMDQMIVFSNGICAFSLHGGEQLSEADLAKTISEVCIGMVIRFQILDGHFRPEGVRAMLDQPDLIPAPIAP